MERTASDFVEDMLRRGLKWTAILAVASSARKGRWYDETKSILQGKGVMPTDIKTINEIRAADAETARIAYATEEAKRKEMNRRNSPTAEQRAIRKAQYSKKAAPKAPPKTVNYCDFS